MKDSRTDSTSMLFLYLGLAGQERMHSQMIAWTFSPHSNALTEDQKLSLLKKLFPECTGMSIRNVLTEHLNTDILIETDRERLVIENKIKTKEHGDQLQKYRHSANQNTEADGLPSYCYLLSLIDRKDLPDGWKSITYDDLHSALSRVIDSVPQATPIEFDRQALRQYCQTIKAIVDARSAFLEDHTLYPFVFTDGSRKKKDKSAIVEPTSETAKHQQVIQMGNLETGFQLIFYYHLAAKLREKSDLVDQMFGFGESRGSGIIDALDLGGFKVGEHTYVLTMQVQGNAAKLTFQMRDGYGKGEHMRQFCDAYRQAIDDAVRQVECREFPRLNPPKQYMGKNGQKSNGNGYMSVSRKLIDSNEKQWYLHSVDEIVNAIDAAIRDARNIVEHVQDGLAATVRSK